MTCNECGIDEVLYDELVDGRIKLQTECARKDELLREAMNMLNEHETCEYYDAPMWQYCGARPIGGEKHFEGDNEDPKCKWADLIARIKEEINNE